MELFSRAFAARAPGVATVGIGDDAAVLRAVTEPLVWTVDAAVEGTHFERAWLDPEAGKVFCLASGPSKEAVLRIHERAGHPTTEIYEITAEV